MAERNKQELHDDLTSYIRSGGQGGKTTAQDVRSFLSIVIDTFFSLLAKKQDTVNGAASSILTQNLPSSKVLVSDEIGKIGISPVSSSELGHLAGLTAAIQPQLNSKQATITGGATSIISTNLTASKALVSDGSGKVSASAVTSTQLGYVSGVTSAIQTQLNGKASTSQLLNLQRYQQAQNTITGGGIVSWDGVNLKWSQRFIAIPIDKSIGGNGYIDMNMPAPGTVIQGLNGTANVTVSTSGIPLDDWTLLIAEHTIGGNNTQVSYRVMRYNEVTANALLPNHIIVANRNGELEGNPIKLCNGFTLKAGDSLNGSAFGSTTFKATGSGWDEHIKLAGSTNNIWNLLVDSGASNALRFRNKNASKEVLRLDTNGDVNTYGNLTAAGNITAFSDARLKENVRPIESALQKVLKLEGVRYNRIDTEEKKEEIGVIAQKVKEVVPEVVLYNEEKDVHSVDYGRLTALLLEAIKEQQTEINNLKEIIKHI